MSIKTLKNWLFGVFVLILVVSIQKVSFSEPVRNTGSNPKSMTKIDSSNKATRKSRNSLTQWLNKLKTRVNRTKAKHNKIVAVASVRGSKAEDPAPLYWKGKEGQKTISEEELQKFEEAIDLATAGKEEEAKNSLEGFISAYPKSPLVSDAKETLVLLSPSTTEATTEPQTPTTTPTQ